MKKSRIIIPALSMIAFSVVASVVGAVAWFTASRTAQITAGNYAVVKTSAELQAELSGGVATVVDTNRANTIVFNGKLTDGSLDHKESYIYAPDSEGHLIGKKTALSTATASDLTRGTTAETTPTTIYTAATFEIAFTVTFGTDGSDVGLYLDNTSGKTAFTIGENLTAKTAKGFRMAFVPKSVATNSYAKASVLADLQEGDNCSYIHNASIGDAALPGTAYSASDYDLIDSEFDEALPRITEANKDTLTRDEQVNRPDFLGYFKFQAQTQVRISYYVVAWFEGTDSEIRNREDKDDYQTVASLLCFEGVNLQPATQG